MRGKEKYKLQKVLFKRITPAYAGKSLHNACQIIFSQDHPRLCGEKQKRRCLCALRLGSPPPMRGKDQKAQVPIQRTRITPAYAGKSSVCRILKTPCGDHPRLCGEKHSTLVIRSRRLGSPPPMRGKVAHNANIVNWNRITPAYAGKRISTIRTYSPGWDHPRLCGEKKNSMQSAMAESGSPPPMRGKD